MHSCIIFHPFRDRTCGALVSILRICLIVCSSNVRIESSCKMCIALLTTAHPAYKLILIDNRDEYINRPTAIASWWPEPNDFVFGGRDLLRPVQGTWLGVTKSGKIAVLTNFREDQTPAPTAVSRGEIIKKFLTEDIESTNAFVRDVVNQGVARDAGGFSLVCGRIARGRSGEAEQLAVISNRAERGEEVPWICGDVVQTVGLSNAHFHDRTWPKVQNGEIGMLNVVRENLTQHSMGNKSVDFDINDANMQKMESDLIESFFELLSDDALSRQGINSEQGLEAYVSQLRNTILVPPLGRKDGFSTATSGEEDRSVGMNMKADEIAAARKHEVAKVLGSRTDIGIVEDAKKQGLGVSGIYATQKQTIVLVDQNDRVRFIEKTLFDDECQPMMDGEGIVDTQFQIEAGTKSVAT